MQNLLRTSAVLINKRLPMPTSIVNRAASSTPSLYQKKILAIGATKGMAGEAQTYLHKLGYKNTKLLGVYNTKESDEELIAALKEQQWDAISIGGYVNGYDQTMKFNDKTIPTDRAEILVWFNRVLNVIHELAPKSKIILVKSGQDIHDSVQRVLGAEKK